MCLNCSVIGWYARLDVVHPLSLSSASLSLLLLLLLLFAAASVLSLSIVSSFRFFSRSSRTLGDGSFVEWKRMELVANRENGWIDGSIRERWLVNYRRSNLKVLETLAWLATIRDASRYSCVKRGKKWRPRGGRNEPLQNGEWCTRVQIDRRI